MRPTLTHVLTAAFIAYAAHTLRTLYRVVAPPAPSLRDGRGALRPLLVPLWAAAPHGLALSLRLAEGATSLELLRVDDGLAYGWEMGLDWELTLDLLDGGGLRLACAPDAAGAVAASCTRAARQAALRAPGTASAAAAPPPPPVAGLARRAAAAVRRGVLPSLFAGAASALGLGGGGGGGGDGGAAAPTELLRSDGAAAALLSRALRAGRAVRLHAVLAWAEAPANGTRAAAPAPAAPWRAAAAPWRAAAARWVPGGAAAAADAAEAAAALAAGVAAVAPGAVPPRLRSLAAEVALVAPAPYAPQPPRRFLWRDALGEAHAALPAALGVPLAHEAALRAAAAARARGDAPAEPARGAATPHWRAQVDLRLLLDTEPFARGAPLPPQAAAFFRVTPDGAAYLPALVANPVRPTQERTLPVNATTAALPLRLTLSPVGAGTFALMRACVVALPRLNARRSPSSVSPLTRRTPACRHTPTPAQARLEHRHAAQLRRQRQRHGRRGAPAERHAQLDAAVRLRRHLRAPPL